MITGYTKQQVNQLTLKDLQGILEAEINLKREAQGGKPRGKKNLYSYEIDAITKLKENYNANSPSGH